MIFLMNDYLFNIFHFHKEVACYCQKQGLGSEQGLDLNCDLRPPERKRSLNMMFGLSPWPTWVTLRLRSMLSGSPTWPRRNLTGWVVMALFIPSHFFHLGVWATVWRIRDLFSPRRAFWIKVRHILSQRLSQRYTYISGWGWRLKAASCQKGDEALLEVLVEEAVHHRVGHHRGHGHQVAEGEYLQHNLAARLGIIKRLECVDKDVEQVQWSPGHKEDDCDGDKHPVCLPPPLHLSRSSVRGEGDTALPAQTLTHSKTCDNIRLIVCRLYEKISLVFQMK